MQKIITISLLIISSSIFMACSDENKNTNASAKKDHVWKEQTETIDKAREVEGILMNSAEETRKAVEQQSK